MPHLFKKVPVPLERQDRVIPVQESFMKQAAESALIAVIDYRIGNVAEIVPGLQKPVGKVHVFTSREGFIKKLQVL